MELLQRFLQLSGVKGDSKVKGYEGWMELLHVEFAKARKTSPSFSYGGSNEREDTVPMEISVGMSASPTYSSKLFQLALSGSLIPEGILHERREGDKAAVEIYRFTGMMVRAHRYVGTGEEGAPYHQLTLAFQSFRYEPSS